MPQLAVAHRPVPQSSGSVSKAGQHLAAFPAFHFTSSRSPDGKLAQLYNFPVFWNRLAQLWLLEETQGGSEQLNES